jgi:hypothetical protein
MTLHFTGRAELMASFAAWCVDEAMADLLCDGRAEQEASQMCLLLAAALRDTPMGGDGEGNAKGSV